MPSGTLTGCRSRNNKRRRSGSTGVPGLRICGSAIGKPGPSQLILTPGTPRAGRPSEIHAPRVDPDRERRARAKRAWPKRNAAKPRRAATSSTLGRPFGSPSRCCVGALPRDARRKRVDVEGPLSVALGTATGRARSEVLKNRRCRFAAALHRTSDQARSPGGEVDDLEGASSVDFRGRWQASLHPPTGENEAVRRECQV